MLTVVGPLLKIRFSRMFDTDSRLLLNLLIKMVNQIYDTNKGGKT